MKLLRITLPSAAENLALDEALLDAREGGENGCEDVVRLWELPKLTVVLGRGSQREKELNLPLCDAKQASVVRRSSGGLSIVAGPGCLMYSVVVGFDRHPELRDLDAAHAFVLERIVHSLSTLLENVSRQGTSDLVWGVKKFSGNALRCKRGAMLYHGTLLYDFPEDLIEGLLLHPPREPEYRQGRSHEAFVTNVPLSKDQLSDAICDAFAVDGELTQWPEERVQELMKIRYGQEAWHLGRS